ncbi:hypothetical protein [Bartonella gliris]|uniref:hypothetical protein n=1 Tax=Bartonella gliris TaxID=3004109 RepID=UPI00295F0464|nr:hypothetical protein [Bartonella gliris]
MVGLPSLSRDGAREGYNGKVIVHYCFYADEGVSSVPSYYLSALHVATALIFSLKRLIRGIFTLFLNGFYFHDRPVFDMQWNGCD